MKGTLYLIPVTIGNEEYRNVITEHILDITRRLRIFIVEDVRSARRYLRHIDRSFPVDDSMFFVLSEHTNDTEILEYLDPLMNGADAGVMSEAGLPCIADPGSKIVALAHSRGVKVVPLPGPSSIILALIGSGLNGQNFTFNGYLPVKHPDLAGKLKELEKISSGGIAQIFMETPYRNQKMLEIILSTCNDETRLCIAENLTMPDESVRTKKIREWRKDIPSLKDRLVVYVLQR